MTSVLYGTFLFVMQSDLHATDCTAIVSVDWRKEEREKNDKKNEKLS